jgi:hypothetical protein
MSETVAVTPEGLDDQKQPSLNPTKSVSWRRFSWSLLWISLIFAILARVWLIVHTSGVMDGDEATVGLQAEHILRGEFPVYYYGQAYLGSFQAYIIALLFLFTGPTVWAMRIEPTLTSLLIVYLTWHMASRLAEAARLSSRTKLLFVGIAALVAALAPLYDLVGEMKVTGGYDDAFAIMLWLLLCVFRLTQRWHEQASQRELALRWSGLGFLIGLGLWIDPLVVYVYLALAIWLGGFFFVEWRSRRQRQSIFVPTLLKEAFLSVCAFPFILIGFTPGLIWGAQNHWANISYIFQNGAPTSPGNRLYAILKVGRVYFTCLAPRAFGGTIPTQPDVTPGNPHILTFGFVVAGSCFFLCLSAIVLSFFTPKKTLTVLRQLTLLPVLFILCVSVVFCLASISAAAIYSGCGPVDYAGRYVVPLVITLPFPLAAIFILPALYLENMPRSVAHPTLAPSLNRSSNPHSSLRLMQIILGVVLVLYFIIQGVTYAQADPLYTFHPTGCVAENPTEVTSLIEYMQQADIRYVWASSWVGNRITFLTDGAIIATDIPGRISTLSQIVLHQDRPSIYLLARQTDSHPAFLQTLDAQHVTYHVKRFYAEPGIESLVVTPLNRTISPLDPAFASEFQKFLIGCV